MTPLTGIVIAVASFVDEVLDQIAQPRSFAVVLMIVTAGLGALLWWSRGTVGLRQQLIAMTSVAVFGGLIYGGIVRNSDVASATDKVAQVARAKARIPVGATLYSLGNADHGFAYFYRDPIARTPLPEGRLPEHVEYFLFREPFDDVLAFAWEALAFVNMATTGHEDRPRLVIVARKLPGEADPRPTRELVTERYMATQAGPGAPD